MALPTNNHVLYHNPYSLCSLMVRYSYAFRGKPRDAADEINLALEEVDLGGGQLTEHYLCDINANGEVPVLAPPAPAQPMPESVDITYYIAQRYPNLLPTSHEGQIKELLEKLHDVNFYSLTYTGKSHVPKAGVEGMQGKLKEEDISTRYRKAIEHKIRRVTDRKVGGLVDETVEAQIVKTKQVLQDFEKVLPSEGPRWAFGTENPTALDAHMIVFIMRMLDKGRDELIPEKVRRYALAATEGPGWKEMMQGRTTLPPNAA